MLAVDGGPRETLLPAAQSHDTSLEALDHADIDRDPYWQGLFDARAARLLVVGTSDSARGRLIEAAARRAARRALLPVVAIEDFPGNYCRVRGGDATLVVVESIAARTACLQRLGSRAPPVEVLSPARYDPYRERLSELRDATAASWDSALRHGAQNRVLWAGQPETHDNVHTLQALLPALRAHRVKLVFKAHPRDEGYASGRYHALLESAGVPFEDMTTASVAHALAAAPQVVLTQFSSVAIEAGFYGIPSVCILLTAAGGARLRQKKGYGVPPFCSAGAAAFVADPCEFAPTLESALTDASFRRGLLRAFDGYFEVRELKAPALLERLCRTAAEGK